MKHTMKDAIRLAAARPDQFWEYQLANLASDANYHKMYAEEDAIRAALREFAENKKRTAIITPYGEMI